jgi:hypothetical protein
MYYISKMPYSARRSVWYYMSFVIRNPESPGLHDGSVIE